jgi:hypothetical protein
MYARKPGGNESGENWRGKEGVIVKVGATFSGDTTIFNQIGPHFNWILKNFVLFPKWQWASWLMNYKIIPTTGLERAL